MEDHLHVIDPGARTTHKRKRIRRACDPCARKKKKCDGNQPCQLCEDMGYECSYLDIPGTRRKTLSKDVSNQSSPAVMNTVSDRQTAFTAVLSPSSETQGVAASLTRIPLAQNSIDASSVLTFPETLTSIPGAQNHTNPKPLIYTLGLREAAASTNNQTVRDIIDLETVLSYCVQYFKTIHIWHDDLLESEFTEQVKIHWQDPSRQEPAFEILVAFIVALGSFFSWPSRYDKEELLVDYATSWMNRDTFPDASTHASTSLAAAYIARAVYVRATASPRAAWMASCEAVHLVESMGFHREWQTTAMASSLLRPSESELEQRRRLFWLAKNVNAMISAEYGRSRVHVADVTCLMTSSPPGQPARVLSDLASMLPEDNYASNEELVNACIGCVSRLERTPGNHAYVQLVRGDMACLAYRRIISTGTKIKNDSKQQILSLGKQAMQAAVTMANEHTPWWKLNQTPFQFLCTLLSMDDADSLPLVPDALQTIQRVDSVFGTIRTKNACESAQRLIKIAIEKKEKGLQILQQSLNASPAAIPLSDFELPDFENDIDWAQLMSGEFWGIDMGI